MVEKKLRFVRYLPPLCPRCGSSFLQREAHVCICRDCGRQWPREYEALPLSRIKVSFRL